MKSLCALILVMMSSAALSDARVIYSGRVVDQNDAKVEVTGDAAKVLRETISKGYVKTTADTLEIEIKTQGSDRFHSRPYVSGSIVCQRAEDRCLVDGTSLTVNQGNTYHDLENRSYVTVMGLGTLKELDTANYFNCRAYYNNVSCEFDLQK